MVCGVSLLIANVSYRHSRKAFTLYFVHLFFCCDYACFTVGQWTKVLHRSCFTYKFTVKSTEIGGYSFTDLFFLPTDQWRSSLVGVAGLSFQQWVAEAGLSVQSNSVRQAWATGHIDINQLFSIFLTLWPFKTVPPYVFSLQLLNYFHCYFITVILLLLWIII